MTTPHTTRSATARCLLPITLVTLAGCSSLPPSEDAVALRQSVIDSVRQSFAETPPAAASPESASDDDLGLSSERITELQELSGPGSYIDSEVSLGPDLSGGDSAERAVTIARATELALLGEDDARAIRLAPPITRAQLIQAEAAFDWVLFANFDRAVTDQEQPVPIVGAVPVGTGLNRSDSISGDTGLRKRLTTNGTLELRASANVFNNATAGFSRAPDPARGAALDLTFTQPLLRRFGSDVALAEVRLAENANFDAIEQARGTLITTITSVESAYWNLRLAREQLLIQERLLDRGIETREALRGRYGFDVTDAELADAAARVENRRGDLIRAQRVLRNNSDTLKRLINDPDIPLIDESVLVAVDEPLTTAFSYDLRESVAGAVERRPDVRRALIRVQDAAVREGVARNAVLPQLDLRFQLVAQGLDAELGDAIDEAAGVNFLDAAFGLTFEMPLGNRDAEAGRRAARLRSLQSSIEYRGVARRAIEDVKAALRTVATNFRLLEQTHLARLAAAENLRALQVEEETIRGLTPDFLNLKLNRQEALALAELDEAAARADYAVSIADASRALGLTLEQAGVTVDPDALDELATRQLNDPDR